MNTKSAIKIEKAHEPKLERKQLRSESSDTRPVRLMLQELDERVTPLLVDVVG
jgi:hypothetical protein